MEHKKKLKQLTKTSAFVATGPICDSITWPGEGASAYACVAVAYARVAVSHAFIVVAHARVAVTHARAAVYARLAVVFV